MSQAAAVQLDAVTRRFGRIAAVDDVSLDVVPGEVLGLLGPNGAGKTTTMRLITGYLRPDRGTVTVGGIDMATDPVAARRLIGYVPEAAAVPRELTVRGYLTYCAKLRTLTRPQRGAAVTRAISRAGLEGVAGRTIATLSKGYRQRVALAQAIVHDPPILILDEPTVGLDPRQVAETRALIAKLGRQRAVLFSSHLLTEVAALCRRVAVIDGGRLVATREVAELTRASGSRRLEARVTSDATGAARTVAHIEGVTSAVAQGERVVIRGRGDDLAARVSAAIVGAGVGLIELRADDDSLEEAYLRIVRD